MNSKGSDSPSGLLLLLPEHQPGDRDTSSAKLLYLSPCLILMLSVRTGTLIFFNSVFFGRILPVDVRESE